MQQVLQGLQGNEESRVEAVRAALRKNVVYEVSLVANRQYDMNGMVEIMESINVVSVCQCII
jgi:hypothetical protein